MTKQPAITKETVNGQLVLSGNAFKITQRYGTSYLEIGDREFALDTPNLFSKLHVYAQNEIGEETYRERWERQQREKEYRRQEAEAAAAQRKAEAEAQATVDQMRAAFKATGKTKEQLLAEMFGEA